MLFVCYLHVCLYGVRLRARVRHPATGGCLFVGYLYIPFNSCYRNVLLLYFL